MEFIRPNVIACPGSRDLSQAFVARAEAQDRVFVGLAFAGRATDSVRRFEDLACFVWETCYGLHPFHAINWFDCRWNPDSPSTGNGESVFTMFPTTLWGHVQRSSRLALGRHVRVDNSPKPGDRYVVETGREWARAVPLRTLPTTFQLAVRRSLVQPLRGSCESQPACPSSATGSLASPLAHDQLGLSSNFDDRLGSIAGHPARHARLNLVDGG